MDSFFMKPNVSKSTTRRTANTSIWFTTTDGTRSRKPFFFRYLFELINILRVIVVYSWDEWVPINRILKLNEENLKKQQELIVATRYNGKEIKEKILQPHNQTQATSQPPPPQPQHQQPANKPIQTSQTTRTAAQTTRSASGSSVNTRKRNLSESLDTTVKQQPTQIVEVPKKKICTINIQPKVKKN